MASAKWTRDLNKSFRKVCIDLVRENKICSERMTDKHYRRLTKKFGVFANFSEEQIRHKWMTMKREWKDISKWVMEQSLCDSTTGSHLAFMKKADKVKKDWLKLMSNKYLVEDYIVIFGGNSNDDSDDESVNECCGDSEELFESPNYQHHLHRNRNVKSATATGTGSKKRKSENDTHNPSKVMRSQCSDGVCGQMSRISCGQENNELLDIRDVMEEVATFKGFELGTRNFFTIVARMVEDEARREYMRLHNQNQDKRTFLLTLLEI